MPSTTLTTVPQHTFHHSHHTPPAHLPPYSSVRTWKLIDCISSEYLAEIKFCLAKLLEAKRYARKLKCWIIRGIHVHRLADPQQYLRLSSWSKLHFRAATPTKLCWDQLHQTLSLGTTIRQFWESSALLKLEVTYSTKRYQIFIKIIIWLPGKQCPPLPEGIITKPCKQAPHPMCVPPEVLLLWLVLIRTPEILTVAINPAQGHGNEYINSLKMPFENYGLKCWVYNPGYLGNM